MTLLHVFIWVDHHYFHLFFVLTIILLLLLIYPIFFGLLVLLLQWSISGLTFASFLHISLSVHFIHWLLTIIIFTLDMLRFISHQTIYTCCIIYTRVWVLIIGYFEHSFISFLSPYYPSLCFVLCLKTTLRPWHHTLCLITLTWTILEIDLSCLDFDWTGAVAWPCIGA